MIIYLAANCVNAALIAAGRMEIEMNGQNFDEEKHEIEQRKKKKTKIIIIVVFAVSALLLAVFSLAPGLLEGGNTVERETLATIAPEKLHDTKEEDFDIMEYEEYLKYDRTVYLDDKLTGVRISIDESTKGSYGQGLEHLYELIKVIIDGDSETYNSMVSESVGHYEYFTQQQIYDIVITKHSTADMEENGKSYTEYVFLLEYKIHENNGSFRNTVESDSSRPQYIVINDSTGELLVMDIIDIVYKN